MKKCREAQAPVYIIGNGSDLLIPDQGLRGVVIGFGGDFCKIRLEDETKIVWRPGGYVWRSCCQVCP